jgi:hypothetical protein
MQHLSYICPKHKAEGIQYKTYADLRNGRGCPKCGYDAISGENHYYWEGGISPLQNYLRDKIYQWRTDSFKNCNYRCVLTNSNKDLIIYHLYSF